MPFWVQGRDGESGRPDRLFLETDDEVAARAEAEAQGLIVEAIERAEPEAPNAPATCPRCGGVRVVEGSLVSVKALIGAARDGGSCTFRPDATKFFRLSLSTPYIPLRDEAILCVDCGLVQAAAEGTGEMIETLRSWGSDELKRRLGLDDANA